MAAVQARTAIRARLPTVLSWVRSLQGVGGGAEASEWVGDNSDISALSPNDNYSRFSVTDGMSGGDATPGLGAEQGASSAGVGGRVSGVRLHTVWPWLPSGWACEGSVLNPGTASVAGGAVEAGMSGSTLALAAGGAWADEMQGTDGSLRSSGEPAGADRGAAPKPRGFPAGRSGGGAGGGCSKASAQAVAQEEEARDRVASVAPLSPAVVELRDCAAAFKSVSSKSLAREASRELATGPERPEAESLTFGTGALEVARGLGSTLPAGRLALIEVFDGMHTLTGLIAPVDNGDGFIL